MIELARRGAGLALGLTLALVGSGAAVAAGPPGANPDGRAYEMVSPPDKGGVPLSSTYRTLAAPSGDAVVFPATGSIGGAPTSLNSSFYLARRSSGGWSFDPVDPPLGNFDVPLGVTTRFMSESLDRAYQVSNRALVPGAQEGDAHLYLRDNLTGQRTLVASAPGSGLLSDFGAYNGTNAVAGNSDMSSFVFATSAQLLPEAAPSTKNIYEVSRDGVRLVNVLPDGSTPSGRLSVITGAMKSTMVSEDGRRIYFIADTSGGLYLRQDGTTTIPISSSRRPGEDPTVALPAEFAGASADGGIVYFTSSHFLTPDADNCCRFLYRYDVEEDELTYVSKAVNPDYPIMTDRAYAVSADGSAVYTISRGILSEDTPLSNPYALYRFDGDGAKLIALADGVSRVVVSDNFRYLAFISTESLTGYDNADARCRPSAIAGNTPNGICSEMFFYDAAADDLKCVTCVDAGRPNGHVVLPPGGYQQLSERVARTVTDDGQVFFTSEEALVPDDVNGKYDAYQWRDGESTLISSGREAEDSFLVEASEDGEDAFFMTSERLVAADVDDAMDLYDARVGGGIPAQNVAPPARPSCDGDDCQGPLLGTPAADLLGSLGLGLGAGDQTARRRVTVRASLVAGSVRGASFTLRVRTAGRGRIVASGPALRRATKAVRGAGAAVHRVRLKLDAGARRRLLHTGRLRVRARVAFAAASGGRSVSFVSVTLKRPVGGGAKGGLR